MVGDLAVQSAACSVAEKCCTNGFTAQEKEVVTLSSKGAVYMFQVSSKDRFQKWLTALKVRYWIDFGNQDGYKVDWSRKLDSGGGIAELIIKLHRGDGDNEGQHLFTITVYFTKYKFMIQGKYRDLWKTNDFGSLSSFVDDLSSVDNTLNPEVVSSIYADNFQDASVEKLNLNGISLDVTCDSDSDEELADEIGHEMVNELRSPRRNLRRKKKKLSFSPYSKGSKSFSPPRKVPKSKVKNNVTGDENINPKLDPKLILDFIESVNSRFYKLDDVVARMDSTIAASDLELNVLNDNLTSSNQEISESFKLHLKHELVVMRQCQEDVKSALEDRLLKVESDVKRLQGRVGSLVEEKAKLNNRIKTLEETNGQLREEVASLITVKESLAEKDAAFEGSDHLSSQVEENIIEGDGGISDRADYDFVILCDSNRRHLKIDQLCPKGNSKIFPCNTTDKAIEILSSPSFNVRSGVILHTGVNDVEHLSLQEIVTKQVTMVRTALQAFPDKKVIMSSVTPRCDNLDSAVFSVNEAVYKQIKDMPAVTLVDNGNLRVKGYFNDVKHLNKYGVPAFAGNLKRGIRQALGIVLRPKRASGGRIRSHPQEQQGSNKGTLLHDVRLENQERSGETGGSRMDDVQSQLLDIATILKQIVHANTIQSSVPQQRLPFLPMPPGLGPGLGFPMPPGLGPGLGLHSPQFNLPQQQARVST